MQEQETGHQYMSTLNYNQNGDASASTVHWDGRPMTAFEAQWRRLAGQARI